MKRIMSSASVIATLFSIMVVATGCGSSDSGTGTYVGALGAGSLSFSGTNVYDGTSILAGGNLEVSPYVCGYFAPPTTSPAYSSYYGSYYNNTTNPGYTAFWRVCQDFSNVQAASGSTVIPSNVAVPVNAGGVKTFYGLSEDEAGVSIIMTSTPIACSGYYCSPRSNVTGAIALSQAFLDRNREAFPNGLSSIRGFAFSFMVGSQRSSALYPYGAGQLFYPINGGVLIYTNNSTGVRAVFVSIMKYSAW